jgi:hypothetical protein
MVAAGGVLLLAAGGGRRELLLLAVRTRVTSRTITIVMLLPAAWTYISCWFKKNQCSDLLILAAVNMTLHGGS